jgi:DNA repair exonuclease SbcCD ATPase subunit
MIKFERLRLTNFKVLAYADISLLNRGLVLVVGDNQDTDAATSNGAGKTTIFEAISWVLYGELPAHGKLTDKVIRHGTNEAEVELSFRDDDRSYRVTRTRNKRGGSLTWCVNDVVMTGRTQADTQTLIIEALGLDWNAFRNTVLYGQGDVGRFADRDTTDGERKAILKKILNLGRFDDALARVRAVRAALVVERTKLNQELSSGQALLGRVEDEIERARRMSDLWHTTQEQKVATARQAIAEEADVNISGLSSTIVRLEELEGELLSDLDDYERFKNELRAIELEVRDLRAESLRNVKETTERELARQRAIKRHREYTNAEYMGRCPECGQTLAVHVTSMQGKVEAALKAVTDIAEEIERLDEERRGIEGKTDAACERMQKAKELVDYCDSVASDLGELRVSLREARRSLERANTVERRRAEAQQRLNMLLAQDDSHMDRLVELQFEAVRRGQNLDETRDQLAKLDAEDAPLAFWEQGYGNKGLPSFAMDSVLPLINMAAAKYLNVLSDGDLQVELTSTTDKKDGSQKESIDLRVVIEGAEGVIPSGGQWRKISLAVDLALMDLVASREGSRIDALFLDEALDGLDEEGRARVVQLLRGLRETRSTILVVTHDPSVAEHVPDAIVVTKKGLASTVEG